MKRTLVTAMAVIGFACAAFAQQAPAPNTTTPPAAAAPPAAANVPQPNTMPVNCRAQAREKGLRGPDARDSIAICREEQRLACTKEAVERKIGDHQRREFIRNCSGRGGAKAKIRADGRT